MESEVSARDSASARLAELIYNVCPASRPVSDDARQPRCDFEGWFSQPESVASRHLFRLYPWVQEVESEVEARAAALARRSKLLSQIFPNRSRSHGSTTFCFVSCGEPVVCPVSGGQDRRVEALGLHHLFRDGAAGAYVPVSTGVDVVVSLADVRNISHAEA